MVVGDHVLTASPEGSIKGLQLKTGAISWSTPIGEVVEGWCRSADNASVIVKTRDRKKHLVTIATGALSDIAAASMDEDSCELPDGELPTPRQLGRDARKSKLKFDGLDIRAAMPQPDGTTIVTGQRTPGTAVPTVALVANGTLKWQSSADSVSPLESSWDASEPIVGNTDTTVAVVYQSRKRKAKYIAAFALADGRRLWEAALTPDSDFAVIKGVVGNGNTFLLASWTTLKAFDTATGTAKFTVGEF